MPLHVFNVDLIGPTFTIQTDESLDYMQSLVMRLRDRLGSLKESTRVSDPMRLSILLNITLMDELQRARERSAEDGEAGALGAKALDPSDEEKEFASITARLIADLDRSLESPEGPVLVHDAPDRVK